MIKKAYSAKVVGVTVVNKIGVLDDISKITADHGINIEALAGYIKDSNAHITLLTDDNLRAKDALVKAGYKAAQEEPVVVVELENKPGALKNVTSRLNLAGVDIRYLYGTTCPDGCPAKIVLATNNDEKALLAFKK